MIPGQALNRRQFLSLVPQPGPAPSGYLLHVARNAMACRFEITLPAANRDGVPAAQAALDEIDRLEAQLSVYREDSEVSSINRLAAQAAVPVEPRLFELLVLCRQLYRETGGAFDITAGPLIRCWGFFQRAGRIPEPQELELARKRVGMSQVLLNPADCTLQFARPGMEINLGSIGKGYALDQAASTLRTARVTEALLSGGRSSVVAVGGDSRGWSVGVRNPHRRDRRIAALRLRDAAMGVSGAGEQNFVLEGKRYGHILDPRSGAPASGVAGAAVVASSGALADALATAFFVGGFDMADEYCRTHPEVFALMVAEDASDRPRTFGSHPGVAIESFSID